MLERIPLNRDNLSSICFLKGKDTSDCVIKSLSNDAGRFRVFVDLQGAFGKTRSGVVMNELAALGISEKLLHWTGDYLHGRRACVWYHGCLRKER